MRREKFIISTLILMIGGFLTKLLGMIIKMCMSRMLGSEGMGLYMLVLPTFSLLIGICQFGIPVALSKLVAEDTKNNRQLLFSLLPISLIVNLTIIFFVIFSCRTLAIHFLHEPRSQLPILAMCVVLPLTSCSGIVRSYFFGKQQMLPHVVSNVLEDIVRLLLIILFVPMFLDSGLEKTVSFIILTNVISELSSIVVLYFFLPKHLQLKRSDFAFSKDYVKEAMHISIPSTASRFVGSIGYFLEPIILTSTLYFCGYSSSFVLKQYGILSGFVLPLLLLPSFFTLAISQALLPVIAKLMVKKKKQEAIRKVKQAIFFSLLIGVPISILFMLYPEVFLQLIYHTKSGSTYLRVLAPIFLLQYIQAPLSASLDAMGRSKDNFKAILFSTLIRTIFLFGFSLLHIGLWGLIIATSCNIFFMTFYNYYQVKRAFQ